MFVLGFMLQYAFAVYPNKHDWPEWVQLRTSRLGPDTWFAFFIPTGEQWRYLILPAITLACVSTALAARMTRGSMLEVIACRLHAHGPVQGPVASGRSSCATACATR